MILARALLFVFVGYPFTTCSGLTLQLHWYKNTALFPKGYSIMDLVDLGLGYSIKYLVDLDLAVSD